MSCFLRRRDEGYPLAEHEVLAIQNFLLPRQTPFFSPLHIVLLSGVNEDVVSSDSSTSYFSLYLEPKDELVLGAFGGIECLYWSVPSHWSACWFKG